MRLPFAAQKAQAFSTGPHPDNRMPNLNVIRNMLQGLKIVIGIFKYQNVRAGHQSRPAAAPDKVK